MSSRSKGAPNEELHNILVHHIFFNVTTLLNSIEKKTIFKYHKMLKLEKNLPYNKNYQKFWPKPKKWHVYGLDKFRVSVAILLGLHTWVKPLQNAMI